MQGKLNRRDLLKATVGATVAASVLSPGQRAAQAGIPTIFSDTPPPKDFAAAFANGNPIAFVGVDVRIAAARASAKLVPLLPKGAEVVVVNHEPGNRVLEIKTGGYLEGIASLEPKVEKLVIGEETTKAVE